MLQDRRSDLLIKKINELRLAFKQVIELYPFIIDGMVVLPDHLHIMMTLPPDDTNYSQRLGFIKSSFSRQVESLEPISASRHRNGNEVFGNLDFGSMLFETSWITHVIWITSTTILLKHGYVKSPAEWQYSSIHRYINTGILRVIGPIIMNLLINHLVNKKINSNFVLK